MTIQNRQTADAIRYQQMSTEELRSSFLIDGLFEPDVVNLHHVDIDRIVLGSIVPVRKKLELGADKDVLGTDCFTERRELGVFNIGADGVVTIDGKEYRLDRYDTLYIGRGRKQVEFASVRAEAPAKFYIASYPAHHDYPVAKIRQGDFEPLRWGEVGTCNKRTLHPCINPNTVQACQLSMGCTELAEGSNWNTFPSHLHPTRSEAYLYFNMPDGALVFHMMGKPEATRHIVVRNEQVVLAPSWSIHSGVGTRAYSFLWAMGGEDREFLTVSPVGSETIG